MGESIHILHVDDDLSFADTAARLLEREDDRFIVETVTDPGEGMDILSTSEFDCIVSDYEMPQTDGIEFLKAVREDHPELPFILFTGKGSEDVASDALSAGATDYLQKGSGTDRYELLANRIQNSVEQYHNKQRRAVLERIRRIVNDVNQALIRASSHQQIETQVCDILADADPYRFAVVADVDEETKQIQPSTWAGKGEEFLDRFEMSVAEDAPGRKAPGGRAFHKREIAIAQDIQSDPTYEHWRSLALEHGFQSLAVVPLDYDTEFYGLLAVLADRPNAFEESEQEALEELGDDIAHALASLNVRNELERYQEYTERMLDAIDDLFFVHDTEGNLQRWNNAFTEVTGYSDEEIASMKGIDFVPEEHRERTAAAIERVFETGHTRLEASLLTKSGETIPYEYAADRVEHPDGEPRLVGVGRDISKRRKREQELRESERRYRTLAENFPNGGVFLLDEDLRYQLVSGAGFDAIETSPDDLTGNTVAEVDPYSDEIVELLETTFTRALEGETTTTELTYVEHIYDLRAVPVRDHEGAVTQVLAITQDMTERKEQKRELKRQNDRLQEFASIVSHDLRNPLNVVGGGSNWLTKIVTVSILSMRRPLLIGVSR
ncbi:PAS domain S-box protein [Haloplanus sp. GCM10025708]|uniref:PAS domain S-box protein n=1 Tax=Haloplanus sp. GCM10025708 TaxID=3252679 RepID=UPI0036186E81